MEKVAKDIDLATTAPPDIMHNFLAKTENVSVYKTGIIYDDVTNPATMTYKTGII